MRKVTILDTSVSSDNLGDEIIMDAVNETLVSVFPNTYFYRVATHDIMGTYSRELLNDSEYAIVGGTNILSSQMWRRDALWKIKLIDMFALRPAVLLAVGWRSYMHPMSRATQFLLSRILSSTAIHSVRDSYTLDKLAILDRSCLNTACVTMWELTPPFCQTISAEKADTVVTTLTYYKGDPKSDLALLAMLKDRYKSVAFWPQQAKDVDYFRQLNVPNIELIAPRVSAFSRHLEVYKPDYVGTRLHGGIRALQKGRRALILAVDNRAEEIRRDTGLTVVQRDRVPEILAWIERPAPTVITLPLDAITSWKQQFG